MRQISLAVCSSILYIAACAADPVDARAQATCDLVPDASSRVWCGPSTYTSLYPSEAECQSKRCCFDASRENSTAGCTYPSYKATPLKKVMVVQASHFDAGFLNSTVNIINLWFTYHFPRAWKIGEELRQRGKAEPRMNFMTQSWLVSLYLDCPAGMGIACPSATELVQFEDSIAKGYLTWHAHPFNSELGIADPVLLATGTDWTHDIDKQFGLAPKATLSQRDVPGIPRAAIIPLLTNRGVKAFSVGANDGSSAPAVPRAFVWRDPASKEDILALWHSHGYGGYGTSDAVVVPGLDTALVFYWLGDNHGPPETLADLLSAYTDIYKTFPGTEVVTAEFDDFVALLDGVRDKLPVLEQEIDETWSHGVASDPLKQAMGRVVMRQYAAAVADKADSMRSAGASDPSLHDVTDALGPAIGNFTRLFIKLIEHTDGKDVKTWLKDYQNWTNEQVFACIDQKLPNWITMIESWQEQRNFDLYYPMDALRQAWVPAADRDQVALHLLSNITSEWKKLEPAAVSLQSMEDLATRGDPIAAPGESDGRGAAHATLSIDGADSVKDYLGRRWLKLGQASNVGGIQLAAARVTVKWDSKTGHITTFDDSATGQSWASASRPLAYLDYRTYSEADFVAFLSEYDSRKPDPPPSYMYKDFGKPNETASHETYGTELESAWIRLPDDSAHASPAVVLRVRFQPGPGQADPHANNGAPEVSEIALWQPAGASPSLHHHADSVVLKDGTAMDAASVRPRGAAGRLSGIAAPSAEKSEPVARWGAVTSVELPLDVTTYNKTVSRLPEAMFVRFNPDLGPSPNSSTVSRWRYHTIGEWMEPADVVIAGNNEYHVTQSGIAATKGVWPSPDTESSASTLSSGYFKRSGGGLGSGYSDPALVYAVTTRDALRSGSTRLMAPLPPSSHGAPRIGVASLDANVAVAGNMTMFPLPLQANDGARIAAEGAGYNLWNNIWSTNYPQWIGSLDRTVPGKHETSYKYRFSIVLA